jgi:hypothetical protein
MSAPLKWLSHISKYSPDTSFKILGIPFYIFPVGTGDCPHKNDLLVKIRPMAPQPLSFSVSICRKMNTNFIFPQSRIYH